MIDLIEREEWRQAFEQSGTAAWGGRLSQERVRAWARSMSLIAEQFAPNDSEETDMVPTA